MNIYILDRTPGAEPGDTVAWTSICHHKEPLLFIRHDGLRSTGRWSCVARKRPFLVIMWNAHRRAPWRTELSGHTTLELAKQAAAKYAKLYAKGERP